MLTKVRLDGVMGKKFGAEWELAVSSPAEALRMIEANTPGLRAWMISNLKTYDAYEVICIYEDGHEEALDNSSYVLNRLGLSEIRFTPTIAGAGGNNGLLQIVVGAILIIASPYLGGWSAQIGWSMVAGGIVQALSPRPQTNTSGGGDAGAGSYYFDGPVNTETQGAPVPLIYGRVLVGSHTISASISVDEVSA